jgi:hypothetical protein
MIGGTSRQRVLVAADLEFVGRDVPVGIDKDDNLDDLGDRSAAGSNSRS